MKSAQSSSLNTTTKSPTGITGFDEITGGGLPCNRTTLLLGGPGSGKTLFALQFLVHGAQHCKEPGIFVAFEETSKRIVANAASFGWDLPELRRKKLYFMDAQPKPDLVQSGDFDLGGMLAALEAKTREMGARRIVFDALDAVLALLPDPAAKRQEIYRLHEWLLAHELSGIITAKAHEGLRRVQSASSRSARIPIWQMRPAECSKVGYRYGGVWRVARNKKLETELVAAAHGGLSFRFGFAASAPRNSSIRVRPRDSSPRCVFAGETGDQYAVFREPMRALAEGIFMTPTLVIHTPYILRRIVGTLSDTQTVLLTLGLEAITA
jgi:KaiC/GvpD/RAD55 family RecA-like ATPase